MQRQSSLFPELVERVEALKAVNVASVPQRSPFRYPGGKTWFVPTFRNWIAGMCQKPRILIEPFTGGGIISLTALFENLVQRVVMAELDDEIAAVWESITQGSATWLAERIITFDLTKDAVVNEINKVPNSQKERAFQTILKNRTFHGGILAEGAGLLKHGENGKGIHSRWYPGTIAKRLLNIGNIVSKIEFRHDDGLKVMKEYYDRDDSVFFIDPPYTAGGKKAGKRLYNHYDLDHQLLFKTCKSLKGDFLMTYDNADEVKKMARDHGFQMRLIPMTNTHHTAMEELVIGKDLSWMDTYPAVHEPQIEYSVSETIKRRSKESRGG
ncbi:MAG: DNA adenine methylase [Proteobacteria bacterium]|nr:DNA adenine methylase [Pseudomonadota bacterium]